MIELLLHWTILPINSYSSFFDKFHVFLWSLKYVCSGMFLQKHKKTIPGESLIGRWLFQLLPADLPDSLMCQDVTCPLSKSSRKKSLIYIWNPSSCSHFQVSSVNCHAPMVLPVLSPPPSPPNLLCRLNKWPRGKYHI